jgi:SAM-dependent methyltransferase/uncharacterized protein YbaR (Trm112 family)
VRLSHFEQLQPICPVCWTARQERSVLVIGHVERREVDDVIEGTLVCSNRLCFREHPIIDGIPVVVVDPSQWANAQLQSVLRREDLSPFTESILGDLAGPGSPFDRDRGNNSIYCNAHWGSARPAYMELFDSAMSLLEQPPAGVWIDDGCSVGRGTVELAALTNQLVVGLDLSFSMLRIAERVRRTGVVKYARRRVGVVFDPVEEEVAGVAAQHISFWCADAMALPFAPGVFDGALCLNLLECTASPLGMLGELGRVLKPGAESILSTPFDWAIGACQPDAWFGGHSQRGAAGGSSLSELRRVLSPGAEAGYNTHLTIEAERDHVNWRLRNNERSATEYDVYFARLRRGADEARKA